jgi:hypothetical protein
MSLRLGRLGGLADLDPRAVPLPAGTEVTTRVDRAAGDRVVGQGALGRVVALDGDEVEVEVVGVGRVRYLRDEVAPRKLGQARYAQRRHDAWAQLAPTVVVDTVVGSRAWGLASETSDTDRRGVFVLPLPWQTGLVDPPLDLGSADGSHAYWEIGKAIRQALRADPNTLEMLFACADGDVQDEMGGWLIEIRDAFASVEIYGSFGRYALSQLDRLEHNLRLSEHRTLVLGWLAEGDPGLDATADRLATSAHVAAPTPAAAVQRARDYLKQLYRSLFDQGLLAANEWSALVDFARSGGAALTAPRELGPKNAYNLIRLLDLAIRWLTAGGAPELRVRDELRPTLLAIKRGEVPMADVVAMARALTPQLEAARTASPLPPRADLGRAEAVLRRVRHEAARRFLAGAPGPWGQDAPAPPAAQFDPP